MKIGILQTGRTPDEMQAEHGDYDDLFKRFLGGRGFDFVTYLALEGILPETVDECDGWLITGSRFGVYDGFDWIPPLEEFLRDAYQANVPIVGVCFGHQILAQALGGKVEKFKDGWAAGPTTYQTDSDDGKDQVIAWHQDQIVELPEEATVLGSNDFCEYALLEYGDKALTIQPHPEFTRSFATDLLEARKDVIPVEVAEQIAATIDRETTSHRFADRFEEFFKRER